MSLQRLSARRYAREVLPLTAPLWAGRRTFDQYVAQTLELARSSYGRRYYGTFALSDGDHRVASLKWYERTLQYDSSTLRAVGFGAVFTPQPFRGRGYASLMLASALDHARDLGHDVAYLFSDIRPQFYADLGFRVLPSRELKFAADALPAERLRFAPLGPEHWRGVRKCFEHVRRAMPSSFVRTPAVWNWIFTRMRQGSEHGCGQTINLVAEARERVCAYVFGARAPQRDAFVFDEYGWTADASPTTIAALLRAAAGDLRRVCGWLPPLNARELLPQGTVRRRSRAILMMVPLSGGGKRLMESLARSGRGDFPWATDHI